MDCGYLPRFITQHHDKPHPEALENRDETSRELMGSHYQTSVLALCSHRE